MGLITCITLCAKFLNKLRRYNCIRFLGRQRDCDWFYKQGTNLFYPDYWQEFISSVPENMLNEIPEYYANCLQGTNELARMSAAKSWALWEARCSSLQPHLYVIDQFSDPHFALTLATLESHYMKNHFSSKKIKY